MLAARPDLWQPYADARQRVLQAAKPVAALKQRYASQTAEIDAAIARTGRPAATLLYLPIVGRQSSWTVLLDPGTAEVLAFLPLDSF
jgi:hypothetical protein